MKFSVRGPALLAILLVAVVDCSNPHNGANHACDSRCVAIVAYSASPSAAPVGSSLSLSATTTSDCDGSAEATIRWTVSDEGFETEGASASYSCTAAGTHELTLAVESSASDCPVSRATIDVTCLASSIDGGTGGAAGAGGAATGGAGGGSAGRPETGGTCNGGAKDGGNDGGCCSQRMPCDREGTWCIEDAARSCFCTGSYWICSRNEPKSTEQALTFGNVGQDNQACLSCAQTNCKKATWPCDRSGSPTDCLRLLSCELESQCARSPAGVIGCYCGTSGSLGDCLYTDAANGPCRNEEESTYTTPEGVLAHFLDPTSANVLAQCVADNCPSCRPSNGNNACPGMTAFRVDPTLGTTGRPIQLTAQAVDDDGPNVLGYLWTANPPHVGAFRDARTPNTDFVCSTAGDTTLTLTISDGDPNCDFSLSRNVSCVKASCQSSGPVTASARAAFTGDSISLKADALDVDGKPGAFAYSWSVAPDAYGTVPQKNAATNSYACVSPGVATVTVTSSKPDGSCAVPQSIDLTCAAAGSASNGPQSTQSALTGSYAGRDNQACWSCATKNGCVDPDTGQACEFRADHAERALCLDLLRCQLESGCTQLAASCYCGTNDGCFTSMGTADGVCAKQVQAGLASMDGNFIGLHYLDPALPGGPANILARCLIDHDCTACFP